MARGNLDRQQSPRDHDPANGRGQTATSPAAIPLRGWWDVLRRVWRSVGEDHVVIIAAGVAFFAVLAIFPAIGAFMALAAIMLEPSQVEQQLAGLTAAMPEEAASILMLQAKNVVRIDSGMSWRAALGLLLALYSASAGMRNLMEGLTIAYDEVEKRGFIKRLLTSLVLTLGLIVGFIVAIACVIALPIIINVMSLGEPLESLLNYLRWPILAAFVIGGLAIIYRYGPSRAKARWGWVSVGAVAAAAVWMLASVGFSIYVSNFASYNETYGSLGAVIVLLMWLWISALVILMGAELNSELEHQTAVDSTTGRPQPMGERGAVKADTRPRGL